MDLRRSGGVGGVCWTPQRTVSPPAKRLQCCAVQHANLPQPASAYQPTNQPTDQPTYQQTYQPTYQQTCLNLNAAADATRFVAASGECKGERNQRDDMQGGL